VRTFHSAFPDCVGSHTACANTLYEMLMSDVQVGWLVHCHAAHRRRPGSAACADGTAME
jgi:hypothetical protein